ncbi:unnamed protein product [Coccothraustes coccothraustes]
MAGAAGAEGRRSPARRGQDFLGGVGGSCRQQHGGEGSPTWAEPSPHQAIGAPLEPDCWLKSNSCSDGKELQPSL